MTMNWSPLNDELHIWRDTGKILPFWWRDDDAIAPTRPLESLSELSQAVDIPVHIAIIPKFATPELARYIAPTAHFIPVVHGFAHLNHAAANVKKSEFPENRSAEATNDDIKTALTRLTVLFGPRLAPMFVPPWNRIAPRHIPALAAAGYTALSTFTPRQNPLAAPDLSQSLAQINTHFDPIDWRQTRSLVEPDRLISQLVQDLRNRREGHTDNSEPYGLLTHHLVHDTAIWEFTAELLGRIKAGPIQIYRHPQKDI